MNVYGCFPGGKVKALTMSYDDGKMEDVRLVSIFNKYGIKGTFNLNAGMYGKPEHNRCPKEIIKELYEGHEVATHTYNHPTIERCPMVQVANEILKDRMELEAITGKLVRGHAYPNGSYTEEIKTLFQQVGIAYGRAVASKPDFEMPRDPMEWNPTCHHNDPKLMDKARVFADYHKKHYLRLMYVWGHSYEFTNDNNWEVIEEFCQFMGGREDIWYATNIEIIDYMEVLKNLKYSADGQSVYNPSVQSAWLQVDLDYTVEIPGGAYVNIAEKVYG